MLREVLRGEEEPQQAGDEAGARIKNLILEYSSSTLAYVHLSCTASRHLLLSDMLWTEPPQDEKATA